MIGKLTDIGTLALAHAIIAQAKRENDQDFLKSDWCDYLMNICTLGEQIVTKHSATSTVHKEQRYV